MGIRSSLFPEGVHTHTHTHVGVTGRVGGSVVGNLGVGRYKRILCVHRCSTVQSGLSMVSFRFRIFVSWGYRVSRHLGTANRKAVGMRYWYEFGLL